jgi:outer membrane receptor protein involved in Fe transport
MNRFAAYASLFVGLCLIVAGIGMQNAWAAAPNLAVDGKVIDSSGSAIVGAKVTIKNLETDSIQKTITDSSGYYKIDNLPAGRYAIAADIGGGQSVALNMVSVSANVASATVAATTAAAQISATVIVNAQAPLVEKATAELDRTVVTKQILELPGRLNLDRLALLQPGVTPNQQAEFGSPYFGIVNSLNYTGVPGEVLSQPWGSNFSVNGTRPNSNYFTIDGAYNMDPVRATNRQSMPTEDLQTFNLITSNFPGEAGRFGGSYINQVVRSGNSGVHGTLNWTWAGNSLNALSTNEQREFNALTNAGLTDGEAYRLARSVNVNNRAEASAGFPIWKDRIFSFTSWDEDWFRSTVNPSTLAVAPAGLANLSAVSTGLAPGSLNLLTSNFPTANIGTNLGTIVLPVSVPDGLGGFTLVNTPVPISTFNRGATGGIPYDRNYWRIQERMDFKISNKNTLNARYLFDRLIDPGYPTAIAGQEVGRTFKNQSAAINDIHIFSSGLVNEFRGSYGRLEDGFSSNLGLGLNIGGFNFLGNPNFPQDRTDNAYQAADFISWTKGRHNFKFGGDAVHYRMSGDFPFNSNGTLTYASLGDFLLNQNATFTQFTGSSAIQSNATEIGVFAQDDWRVSKGFSLNLGLRYEYMQVPEGLFSDILPSQKNFGPRFGFAWAPDAGGKLFEKTVIRGGYSIMYEQEIAWQLLPLVARNFPNGVNTAIGPVSGLTTLPGSITPAEFIAAGGNPDLLPATFVATDANRRLKTPYYQNYSLGIEREFGRDFVFRAFYVGTKGTHQYLQYDANPGITPQAFAANPAFFSSFGLLPVFSPGGDITAFRPNPAFGSTMLLDPIGNSIYNSGQFSLEKRFGYGVQFGLHYTYSSSISDADNLLVPISNPFNPLGERARSNWDQPHRFVGNYTFVVPTIWRDKPFMSRLISGWELSGITTLASGLPFSDINANNALGLLPGQNPTPFTELAFFNANRTPGTASSPLVLNPQFVASPTNSGIIPNLQRNTFRTKNYYNTDLAFVKNTRTFTEDQYVQLRFEAFNVFNRSNFIATPQNVINSTSNLGLFNNFEQTNAPGRSFMMSARYFF